jgi:indolepyruvate ferredoxin oxidoreductase, beta subunit
MNSFNIYLAGVGGQGIGLLSEVLLRAADHAGLAVKSVDTHGLAQRGGIVVSHVRIGADVYTPLIAAREADLVVALERHEALRAFNAALKDGGTLIYYDTAWQPLSVRLKKEAEITAADIIAACERRSVTLFRVVRPDLKEARMQNMAVLAVIDRHGLVPGITSVHYRKAMADLMDGSMLARNGAVFAAEGEPS